MRVFDFDPAEYAEAYRRDGYIHVREGLSQEFHASLVAYAERELMSHKLDDADRDVVMFPGSTTWHLRRNAGRALNLYFKFNDFGADPLGEDPSTGVMRERTLAALGGNEIAELGALDLVPGSSRH